MKISVELTDQQQERLREAASRLNLRPEELAQVALNDFLAQEEEDFSRAANRVLEKNADLYRRLA